MKKLIISIILLFFTPFFAFAGEIKNLDLKKDSAYLLLIDEEAVDFLISNPKVISFQPVDTLINDKQQIIIQALNLGTTTFEVKTKTLSYKFKFSVLEDANPLCENFFEIAKPDEGIK